MKTETFSSILSLFIATNLTSFNSAAHALDLPKQDLDLNSAIELSLNKSFTAKMTDVPVILSDSDKKRTTSIYDWSVTTQALLDISRLENQSGTGNIEDKTKSFKTTLTKKTSTGTTFSFGVSRYYLDSILSSFSSSLRSPSLTTDAYEITFKQDLLANAFGYSDRKKTEAALLSYDRAQIKRLEALEAVAIDTAQIFLKTFVAQENLKNSLSARLKYETLVKTLRYKRSVGLVDASDLAKVEAEFLQQDKRIKQASILFLSSEDALKTQLLFSKNTEINLIVPKDLPTFTPNEVRANSLRKTKDLELGVQLSVASFESSKNSTLPEFNLFGILGANGIDKSSSKSFSELTSNQHPHYQVGVEFKFKIDSDLASAEKLQKQALMDQSELELALGLSKFDDEMIQTTRDVQTKLLIADTSLEITKKWESSIQDQERKYKSGRARLSELIQDYSSYFQSQADLALAQSDFWLSYLQYQSTRDRLVTQFAGKTL